MKILLTHKTTCERHRRYTACMGKPPAPGELAPDFELPDSTATPRRLSNLVTSGPLVLLFYRGYW